MGKIFGVLDADSQELDVEELVDRMQRPADSQVCRARVRSNYSTKKVQVHVLFAPFFNSTTISLPTSVLKNE